MLNDDARVDSPTRCTILYRRIAGSWRNESELVYGSRNRFDPFFFMYACGRQAASSFLTFRNLGDRGVALDDGDLHY